MTFKSFNIEKNKLEKIWNDTHSNLNTSRLLIKQDFKDVQINFKKNILKIPIVVQQDSRNLPELIEFQINNIPEWAINNSKIQILAYKTQLEANEIGNEEYNTAILSPGSFEYWKKIDADNYLLRIQKSAFGQFSPEPNFLTYIDITLIVINPFLYLNTQKYAI